MKMLAETLRKELKLDNLNGKLTDEQLTEQSKIIQDQLLK